MGIRVVNATLWVDPYLSQQIEDGGRRPFLISRNANPQRIKISAPNFVGRCITACGNDHMTKSRNRKLIRVTSSNECLERKCVDLSDYKRYLNQIWHRGQAHTVKMVECAKFTYLENPRWRRPPSWISEKC